MINGGNVSIYVKSIDHAIKFYTELLGLRVLKRIDEEWAELDAGKGMVLGLHPANPPATVAPGTKGSINIELAVDEPLEVVVDILSRRGLKFNGPVESYEHVKLASFTDPDENVIFLAQNINSTE